LHNGLYRHWLRVPIVAEQQFILGFTGTVSTAGMNTLLFQSLVPSGRGRRILLTYAGAGLNGKNQ
jgi:hypothetical protein